MIETHDIVLAVLGFVVLALTTAFWRWADAISREQRETRAHVDEQVKILRAHVDEQDKLLRSESSTCRMSCRADTDELARRIHDAELAYTTTAKSSELQVLIQAVTRLQEQVAGLITQNAGLIAQVEQLRAMVPAARRR